MEDLYSALRTQIRSKYCFNLTRGLVYLTKYSTIHAHDLRQGKLKAAQTAWLGHWNGVTFRLMKVFYVQSLFSSLLSILWTLLVPQPPGHHDTGGNGFRIFHSGPGKEGPFGPYYQSQRLPIYKDHINHLLEVILSREIANHSWTCVFGDSLSASMLFARHDCTCLDW